MNGVPRRYYGESGISDSHHSMEVVWYFKSQIEGKKLVDGLFDDDNKEDGS